MSAARYVQTPVSGRDRRHHAEQLRIAKQAHDQATREAEAAHKAADEMRAKARGFDCAAWHARLFLGGPDEPSPLIQHAIDAGWVILDLQCPACGRSREVDVVEITLVSWRRDRPLHTIRNVIHCSACFVNGTGTIRRPSLIGLRVR